MFSPEQLADLLAMPFFAGLRPATLHQLQSDLEPVHLPGGALLFAAGAVGDSMYVVLSGRLRVSIERDDGSKETVRELARGDTVGELALLTGEPRSAAVSAIRDTRLAMISRAAFERAVKSDPQTARTDRGAACPPRTARARYDLIAAQPADHRGSAG